MPAMRVDPSHTAVLALDCQAGIVAAYVAPPEPFLDRAASVLNAARGGGILAVHVQVGFRPGLPEVGARNALFSAIKANPQHQKLFEGASGAVHHALGPLPDDIVVVKRRISAFTGSDLEVLLRAREIETLVLFGIATSGVVLSTLLEAVDRDYRTIVVADCCADNDAELHRALVERLFPRRGAVISAREFVESIDGATSAP